jgi:hypothetical protein
MNKVKSRDASSGKSDKSSNFNPSKVIDYSALSYLSENSLIIVHPSSIDDDDEEEDQIARN